MATFKAYSSKAKSPKPTDKWYSPPRNYMPYNHASGGNCVWYAYGRFCESAGKVIKVAKSGNACTYFDENKFSPKCKRGQKPQIGAIMCWKSKSNGGNPGHVAFVEEVKPNGDIRITQSGWSRGWLGSKWLYKKENYDIHDSSLIFRGFIYNPVKFDNSVTLDPGLNWGSEAVEEAATAASPEALKITASQLYSSDNYEWIEQEEARIKSQKLAERLNNTLKADLSAIIESQKKAVEDEKLFKKVQNYVKEVAINYLNTFGAKAVKKINSRLTNSIFDISRYLVEAPFVKVNIGGIEIGSYDGSLDKYPNYVSNMNIQKTNGEINHYQLTLIHQIRAGEDPNQLDEVFGRNQFNKITISYGDTSSTQMFTDIEAIITNVTQQRDYAGAKITYVVEATSAGSFITANVMNFPAVTDRPSNVIRKLLYSSPISAELKKAFPMMASQTEVESKGWLPNNDGVISIVAKQNMDPISYINYLVSCMSNKNDTGKVIRGSSYFIFYRDDSEQGAGFEIKEIKINSDASDTTEQYNSIYEVNVGYPDNNNIFEFMVSNDKAWAILYDQNIESNISNEYVYTIMDNGDIERYYSPALSNATNILNEYQKNWWTFMTGFPVTATLTMRGLLRPAFLTNYIRINVVFYGQKHITSGLYAITEQKDTLSGAGFRTAFSLVRVSN